jgi:hypothetical protein
LDYGPLRSAPAVTEYENNGQRQLHVFWRSPGDHFGQADYDGNHWQGPFGVSNGPHLVARAQSHSPIRMRTLVPEAVAALPFSHSCRLCTTLTGSLRRGRESRMYIAGLLVDRT